MNVEKDTGTERSNITLTFLLYMTEKSGCQMRLEMGVPGNEAGAEGLGMKLETEGLGMRLETEVPGNEAGDGSAWE